MLVLLLLAAFLFTATTANAQLAPADDYFHSGAQLYLSNSIPQAKEVVEMGRKLYPDDEKLKKLEELLKQQQNQQQQQQQDQQQKQDQQNKSEDQKQQDQKSQQQKDKSDQQKPDEKKPEEQKKDSGDKPKDERPEQQQAQPAKPGEMTPEEAKKLLDAQKGREQLLQIQPPQKPRDPSRPVKDW